MLPLSHIQIKFLMLVSGSVREHMEGASEMHLWLIGEALGPAQTRWGGAAFKRLQLSVAGVYRVPGQLSLAGNGSQSSSQNLFCTVLCTPMALRKPAVIQGLHFWPYSLSLNAVEYIPTRTGPRTFTLSVETPTPAWSAVLCLSPAAPKRIKEQFSQ